MENLSDKFLWKSLKDGNLKAFSTLFSSYYPRLYNYGLKISKNIQLTEDSLQDFFLYVYEHRENLSDLTSIAPYLFTSYRRFLIKMIKKEQKINFNKELDENIVDIQFTPEEILTHQESENFKNKNLAILLNKLPKRQREVIYLKYFYNLKTAEISEIMGVNYQSISNFLHRAIKNLKEDISILTLFNK